MFKLPQLRPAGGVPQVEEVGELVKLTPTEKPMLSVAVMLAPDRVAMPE
jgi:hypothetical protein